MDLVHGLASLPFLDEASAVTIGFFDGVHLGHRAVFARTVEVARERGLRSVAVTFDRHPREILTPGQEPRLLTTTERKARLIEETEIETLLVLEFTEGLSRVPAEDFLRDVLVGGVHARHAVVGGNFTFGYKAAGTLATLREAEGMTAEGVGLLELEGRRVSSSSIREALAEGDLAWPRLALGRRFVLDGEVIGGAGRGHGLGFPTANLRTRPRLLLPGNGIYAGTATVGAGRHLAAISVGTNPTFGVEPLHVEAYLLDFDGDLLGEHIAIEFWERLRDEERFDSSKELVKAIDEDVERTRAIVRADAPST